MNKNTFNPKKLWFKIAAIGLICAFLCNQVSYAIEPSTLSKSSFTLMPETRAMSSMLQEDANLFYASRIIGNILDSTGAIISAKGLKTLIGRHIPQTEDTRIALEGLYKEGDTFYLPYKRAGDEKEHLLRYYLSKGSPKKVIIEDVETGDKESIDKAKAETIITNTKIWGIDLSEEAGEDDWSKVSLRIDKFIVENKVLLREQQGNIDDALSELLLNALEHAKGSTTKVYAGLNEDLEITEIKIVSKHNGRGMPYDPNEWARKSAERSKSEGRGRGFGAIAERPHDVTIEF